MREPGRSAVFLLVFTCAITASAATASATTTSTAPEAPCPDREGASLFWTQLDALCDHPEVIARATQSLVPETAAAAEQVAAHCDTMAAHPAPAPSGRAAPELPAPELAARVPAERLALIVSLAHEAGVTLPGPPPPVRLPPRETLEDLLLAQLGPTRPWQTGMAMDLLTAELRGAVCSGPAVAARLPNTCSSAPLESPALPSLERALVRDALDLLGAAAKQALRNVEPERQRALLLARAALTAARSGGDLVDVSRALAVLSRADGATLDEAGCSPPDLRRPLSVVAHVLLRLSLEGAHLARNQGAHGERVALRALQEVGLRAAEHTLSGEELTATRTLLQSVQEAHRLRTRLGPGDHAALRALAEAELRALLQAHRLVLGTYAVLPPDVQAAVTALAGGDLEAALQAALALVAPELTAETRAAVQRASRAILRVVRAADEAEARRALRSLVSPLGPWSEDVLFDVNLGALTLTRADRFAFGGDLTLGYQGSAWGVALLGALSAYDYQSESILSETERTSGELHLWYASEGPLRFEGRLSAAFASHGTSRVDYAGLGIGALEAEDSAMFRSAFHAGLRSEPSSAVAWGAWFGAGFQVEDYTSVSSDALGGSFAALEDTTTTTLLLQARLRAQVALIERILVLRARADVKRYGITRDSLGVVVTSGDFVIEQSAAAHTQTEVVARGHLDLEALRFGGFVPALNGGVDVFLLEGTESRSTVVPVFGAGVRRVVF